MNEWSHLSNAHHIDWVLESVKENLQLWSEASSTVLTTVKHNEMAAARLTAFKLAAEDAAKFAARRMASLRRNDLETRAKLAMRGAIIALVAYDDCDQYLSMSYEKLLVYSILSQKPQSILLLPMVYIREKIQNTPAVCLFY